MGGSTKNINTVPSDVQALRGNLSSWLMGNPQQAANAPTGGVAGGGGTVNPGLAGQVPRPSPATTPQPQFNLGGQAGQGAQPSWMQNAPPPLPSPGMPVMGQAPLGQPGNPVRATGGAIPGASVGGGFGGYDPNKPPPGYDPRAWAATGSGAINQGKAHVIAKPDGTTAYVRSEKMGDTYGGIQDFVSEAMRHTTGNPANDAQLRQSMLFHNPSLAQALMQIPGGREAWFRGDYGAIQSAPMSGPQGGMGLAGPMPGGPGPGGTVGGGNPGFNFGLMGVNPDGSPMFVNNQMPGQIPAMGQGPQTYASMGPTPVNTPGPMPQGPSAPPPDVQGSTVTLPPGSYDASKIAAPGAFDRIFYNPQGGPVQAQRQPFLGQPGQIDPRLLGPEAMMMLDQGAYDPRSGYQQVNAQGTQSVDQLGGVNSAFFNNMMGQLQPAFEQQRAEALAQAKAGLGNMGAGTGLANTLGTAMNRSLGAEQAALADYASRGLQTEVGRQQGDASQALQAALSNQGTMAGLTSQAMGNALQAGQANQNVALQGGMANQNAVNAAQAQNIANWMNQGQFNANLGQQQNFTQAGLDQAWQSLVAQMGSENANRFMQVLLGMATAGVGPNQVVQSGGPGALLGPAATLAGGWLAGRNK